MTAYPDFRLPNSASVASLVQDWTKVLSAVPAAIRYRTALDEIGIPALDGASAAVEADDDRHAE